MPGDPFDTIMQSADAALIIVTAAAASERAGCLVGFHSQSSIDPQRSSYGAYGCPRPTTPAAWQDGPTPWPSTSSAAATGTGPSDSGR